jgi:hypothetical protein
MVSSSFLVMMKFQSETILVKGGENMSYVYFQE